MASRRELRNIVKHLIEQQYTIPTFTSQIITCSDSLYATVLIPEAQARMAYVSHDTVIDYDAQLQIVIYMQNLDEDELDTLADHIALSVLSDGLLQAELQELSYIGFEYLDENHGYYPIALSFNIQYRA